MTEAKSPADEAQAASARSRWFAALVASLALGPGAGHLLAGRFARGAMWFVAAVVFALLVPWLHLWAYLGHLGLRIPSAVDAALVRPDRRRTPGWGLALLMLVGFFGLERGGSLLLHATYVKPFKIASDAMLPTLVTGDHIIADRRSFSPVRGDVVLLSLPEYPDKIFVKRVVALGGDSLEIRENVLIINGRRVERERTPRGCMHPGPDPNDVTDLRQCIIYEERIGAASHRIIQDIDSIPLSMSSKQVPPGHAYLLGDNRDNSRDSRQWGAVPVDQIQGRVRFIWMSRDDRDGFRFVRFNQEIR